MKKAILFALVAVVFASVSEARGGGSGGSGEAGEVRVNNNI